MTAVDQVPDPAAAAPVLDTIDLGGGAVVVVTGRAPDARHDRFAGNLADHVGDDPHAVSLRRGALAAQLRQARGAAADQVFLRADHGVALREVRRGGPREVEAVDPAPERFDLALTTSVRLPLAALSADCVPFAVAEPDAGIILVGHAGWRGTAASAVTVAVAAVQRHGGRPDAMTMFLGPAACGACYEVGSEVVEALVAPASCGGDRSGWAVSDGTGWRVDLRSHLAHQASAAGVRPEGIMVSPRCTMTDPALFSHRRDGRVHPTGRNALVVMRSSS
jgi:YfiH family protein